MMNVVCVMCCIQFIGFLGMTKVGQKFLDEDEQENEEEMAYTKGSKLSIN